MSGGATGILLSGVIVEGEALLDSIVASLIAGVTVTFAASMAIYGLTMFNEMRREGRAGAMLGAGLIALAFGVLFMATIAAGLYVMIKG